MSTIDADVIVLGLGAHGAAAAASLARRGVSVVGLDRFAPGHSRGSSHGRTRMIRRAYPNPVWNDLVDKAFTGWAALEAETGSTFVHRTGGLYAHAGEAQLQGPDCIVVDDRARMAELMPGFSVPAGYQAVYDPAAGVVEAARALAAFHEIAQAHGAVLRSGFEVLDWTDTDTGVRIRTTDGELTAGRLIIAGGAWMRTLVPELAPLLEVWRILTLTVPAGQPAGMPPNLGALSVDRAEGLVFGIPDADGNGVKIGIDAGAVWDPERRVDAPTDAEVADLRRLLEGYVPELDTTPVDAAACLYTMTADRRFIVGPLARAPHVVVSSACSGHGFKFAPAIGDALADLATDVPRPDLDFISTARREL